LTLKVSPSSRTVKVPHGRRSKVGEWSTGDDAEPLVWGEVEGAAMGGSMYEILTEAVRCGTPSEERCLTDSSPYLNPWLQWEALL
jgi:hypothetical protein